MQNLAFDFQFLINDLKKHEKPAAKGLVLDTCAIARKVFPGLANYKLSTLVQHLKIPTTGFHRAEEDASYCGHLFVKIVEKIVAPNSPIPLENLVALSGKPEVYFPQFKKTHKQLELSLF